MNHDEVAFLLSVGYSLAEIMRMNAERAQGATEGAQAAGAAAEGAEAAGAATEGAQAAGAATEGAEGAQAAGAVTEATEGTQGAEDALKRENEQLKKQLQDLNRKNAVFEQAKEKTLDEILFQIMEEYK